MDITLYRAFPDPFRRSMSIYAQQLAEALEKVMPPGDQVRTYLPRAIFLKPPARYFSQYFHYQSIAPFRQGDVNHIIDHAYGHLVHTLDAKKTIVTFHDAIRLKSQPSETVPDNRTLINKFNLAGTGRAAWIIFDSQRGKRDFLDRVDYPEERTSVIAFGVDEIFFGQETEDPKKELGLHPGKYLLHVGHTESYKNIPALFHVLKLMREKDGEVCLLKVGTDFSREQIRLAQTLGVEDAIVHLGLIPRKRLRLAYKAADLLLFPSLDEGFGIPVLEAMASGIPVLSSNAGSLPEVVGDAGVLAAPDDYRQMAEKAEKMITYGGFRDALIEKGKARAREFTWEKAAQKTLKVYERVTDLRRQR